MVSLALRVRMAHQRTKNIMYNDTKKQNGKNDTTNL